MILTIKKAEFITSSRGELSSMIEFPVSGKTKKRGFNALVINDHKLMRKAIKGVKLKLDFDENMVINKIDVLTKTPSIVDLPNNCPTCGSIYEEVEDALYCKNVTCPSVSHGCLFKLLQWSTFNSVKHSIKDQMLFLSQFAMSDGTASIDNLTELKMILGITKNKYGTKPRFEQWEKAHPSRCDLLYNMEGSLISFLSSTQTPSVFWDICNFPHITENEKIELRTLDPKLFLSGKGEIKRFSKKTRTYLENNIDFILLLGSVLSDVTWEN